MKVIRLLLILFLALIVSSCATLPPYQEVTSFPSPTTDTVPSEYRQTITHEVAPGETIWRISKMYDVTIEDITEANNLRDVSRIKMGQHIVIPNALPMRPLISLYPNRKWKYIIIHHSGTEIGSAISFDRGHKERGFLYGLGYHFLIDNGTKGKADGQIEISPRWIKQQIGAHCKASSMNYIAIGICLVGNFSKDKPTKKQIESLCALVNTLRRYYRIPLNNIIGHGQVKDAKTECPGKYFFWNEFIRCLKIEEKLLRSVKGKVG